MTLEAMTLAIQAAIVAIPLIIAVAAFPRRRPDNARWQSQPSAPGGSTARGEWLFGDENPYYDERVNK